MSSIHNTQRCRLKAAGVTYERLWPICLTLFSCSSCHAVCMSAAAADRSFSSSRAPHSSPHPIVVSARLRNGLAVWGCSGTVRAATRWPPGGDLPHWNVILSPSPTENKNKSYLSPQQLSDKKDGKALYQGGALTIICPHDLRFLRQGLLDTCDREVNASRLSILRLACPYLLSPPSLLSLCRVCTT